MTCNQCAPDIVVVSTIEPRQPVADACVAAPTRPADDDDEVWPGSVGVCLRAQSGVWHVKDFRGQRVVGARGHAR